MIMDRPLRLSITCLTKGSSTERWASFSEIRSFDADWEHADLKRPIGKNKVKVTTVKPAFSRKISAEIEGVVAGLKPHEVVVAKCRNKTLVVWKRGKDFWWGARDV